MPDTDKILRQIEQLEYLIMKVMSDLENHDRVLASVGASMALDMIGELRRSVTDLPGNSNKQ